MENIGLKLKNKREENGLSINEVAEDLKVDFTDIENLENGLRESFKDINVLKNLIGDYAKYLGFNKEEMIDEFNEYLFDQTSRISLEDIAKAKEMKEEMEKDKISSPYTIEKKEKSKVLVGILIALILVVVFFASYFIVSKIVKTNDNEEIEISYMLGGE